MPGKRSRPWVSSSDLKAMVRVANQVGGYYLGSKVPGGTSLAVANAAAAAGAEYIKRRGAHVVDGTKRTARGGTVSVRSKKYKKKSKKTLKKTVAEIQKELKGDMSYLNVRRIDAGRAICDLGKCSFADKQGLDSNVIISDIASLPIGTGTPINVTGVAENTQIRICNIFMKVTVTNTGLEPVMVDGYILKAKANTAISPATLLRNVMVDLGYGAAGGSDGIQCDLPVYPSQLPDWGKMYGTITHMKSTLRSGDEMVITGKIPDFQWSQDFYNDHTDQYLKRMNMVYMQRSEGLTCYDSANTSRVSTIGNTSHYVVELSYTVEYSGNVASRSYRYVNGLDTAGFTGTPTTGGPNVIPIS